MYGTARRRRARVSHGGVAGELTSRPISRVAQSAGGGRGSDGLPAAWALGRLQSVRLRT